MKPHTPIHLPVKRPGAENYLLLSLLSFALSVTGTRLFLELTGYPQLGNSQLHIAHVLWGGLLLFVAALLPLLYANRWVYYAGGILSGVGVGLFIDEVGKFITQSNDYFYPPAAPIIYAFFLLVVLLYQRTRNRRGTDTRGELYAVLDMLQEVLDHDLDPAERVALVERLQQVLAEAEHPNHKGLAQALLDFLQSGEVRVVPVRRGRWQRWRAQTEEWADRWLTPGRLKAGITAGLLLLGLGALIELALLLPQTPTSTQMERLFLANGQDAGSNQIFLYVMRVILEGAVGVALVTGSLLLVARREKRGVNLSYLGLLVALTIVDLLVFYFDQFSAIVIAGFQFLLLLALLYYRNRYLDEENGAQHSRQTDREISPSIGLRPGEPHEF
ncbi:MAG: hypothetical protein WBO46_01650 [Caldilineaceae bacterium]